jgi:hypothetical protein
MTSDAASPVSAIEAPGRRVRRRRVFYVSGFDPRGPVGYYALFRREFWKFRKASGIATEVSKLAMPEGALEAIWTARCDAGAWQTETSFSFLRWDDIIARVYFRPNWQRLLLGGRGALTALANGQMVWISRESGKFLTVWLGIVSLFFGGAALATALAALLAWGLAPLARLASLPGWSGAVVAFPLLYAAFARVVRLTREAPLYLSHLIDDLNFNWGYLRGRYPDADRRVAAFAAIIAARITAAEDDEVLVIGHSSGPLLAVEALALALEQDPALGRLGPAVGRVTRGSALPRAGRDTRAHRLRRAIARLVSERDVLWVDFQAQWDWLAFWRHDPATACGVPRDPARDRNPVTRKVFIDEVMTAEARAATKYNFFRRHFQFLMAGDGLASYDYFAITCGPEPLDVLAARPPRARMSLMAESV